MVIGGSSRILMWSVWGGVALRLGPPRAVTDLFLCNLPGRNLAATIESRE